MTELGSPNNRGICRHCGLASTVSHASARECVDALLSERNRLKEHVQLGRSADTRVPQLTFVRVRDTGSAVAPRVALAR